MSQMDRRRFLEESFFAASMTAMAASGLFFIPDEAQASPQTPRAPGDKVRIGVIGVRGRGMDHINGYLGIPDAEIVAICDVDTSVTAKAVKAIEAKGGKVTVYQDLRKMFEDKDIDAVSMALPIHWHTLASIWAMQSGKDVYVEKPVCHNVTEGRRIVEAAAKYNRICQGGTQSRSARATQEAIKYIHDGKIGKVSVARGLCYKRRDTIGIKQDAPVPAGVDYDIWLGPAPQHAFNPNRFHYNWHWMWDYGLGDLGNQGIHQMDIARWALNKDTLPNRVQSVGGRFGYVDQGETPNTLVSFYDYGDTQLIFEVRGLKTEPLTGVTIGDIVYGSEGYVVFSSNYGAAAAFDKAGNSVAQFSGGGNHFRNFIEAVKSRKMGDLHAPIKEGALSSSLCHLGNISYRLGQKTSPKSLPPMPTKEVQEAYDRMSAHLAGQGATVDESTLQMGRLLTLDGSHEKFKDDKEADALLTRQYRAPFIVPAKLS